MLTSKALHWADELRALLRDGALPSLGIVTGNTRLEAEGNVQESFGKLTGDLAIQAKGTAEKLRGKAERTG